MDFPLFVLFTINPRKLTMTCKTSKRKSAGFKIVHISEMPVVVFFFTLVVWPVVGSGACLAKRWDSCSPA